MRWKVFFFSVLISTYANWNQNKTDASTYFSRLIPLCKVIMLPVTTQYMHHPRKKLVCRHVYLEHPNLLNFSNTGRLVVVSNKFTEWLSLSLQFKK